jgi:hypothetical protein
VGSNVCDVEFGSLLVVLAVRCLNADGLDGRISNRSSFVGGTVNIFDR